MKKMIIAWLLALLATSSPAFSPAQSTDQKSPLSEASNQWLKEVVPYIISPHEREGFLALYTEEERGRFIEQFWKVRDPDPKTPINEFKIQFYKRIAMANAYFKGEGLPGWRTERGRIFILLGPPMEINRDVGSANNQTPNAQAQHGLMEVWNYFGLSNPKLPYNLEFRFVDRLGTGRYELDVSQQLRNEGNQTLSLDQLSAVFNQMEYLADVSRTPYAHLKDPSGSVETSVSIGVGHYLPLQVLFFAGDQKTTYCPVQMVLPLSILKGKEVNGERIYSLMWVIKIKSQSGETIKEFSREIPLKWPLDQIPTEWPINSALSLPPGKLKIEGTLYDHNQGRVGELAKELEVPDYNQEQFAVSDLLINLSGQATQDERLNLTYELYHHSQALTAPGEGELRVIYEFYPASGQVVAKQEKRERVDGQSQSIRLSTEFGLKGFKAGDYRLKVTIKNEKNNTEIVKTGYFKVR